MLEYGAVFKGEKEEGRKKELVKEGRCPKGSTRKSQKNFQRRSQKKSNKQKSEEGEGGYSRLHQQWGEKAPVPIRQE